MRDSAQSFLTVHVPLYVSYIYVTAPRGWASLEHHTEMEFSFFYDTVLWRTGTPTGIFTVPTLCSSKIKRKNKYCLLIEDAFFILLFYVQCKENCLESGKCKSVVPEKEGGPSVLMLMLEDLQG